MEMNSVKALIFPLYYASKEELEQIDVDQYLIDREIDIYGAFDDFEYEPLLFRALFITLISDQKSMTKLISQSCINKEIFLNLPCKINLEESKKACEEIATRWGAIKDVLKRDEEFTSSEDPINVVILLYNGQYYGHVFSWDLTFQIKPDSNEYKTLNYFNGSKITFMLGIRSRVDSPFLKFCGIQLKGVALFILEAVRQHAITNRSSMIIVPDPWGPMVNILPRFGFQEVIKDPWDKDFRKLPNYLIYRMANHTPGFNKYCGDCSGCYYVSKINEPFSDLDVIDYSVMN